MTARLAAHQRLAAFSIALLAIATRYYGLGFGLPHWFARPDEETAITHAIWIAQGNANPQWFHWPTLYMYVLAVPYAMYLAWHRLRGTPLPSGIVELYFAHPAPFHLIDRALGATLGVLTVYALYRLTRALFSRRIALLAAFFLAAAPLHARDSHFGVTDVPATFLVTLAVLAVVAWTRVPSRVRLLAAGVCCGLAGSVKYNAAIVLVTAVVAQVLRSASRDRAATANAANVAIVGAAAALGFFVGTPYALLTPKAFWAGVGEVGQHMSAGHGLDVGGGWWYHLHATLRYGLGLPLLVAGLAGGGWMILTRPKVAAVLLSFPLVYYAVAGSTHVVFFRYMLPVVPFLCVAAAFLVGRLPGALAAIVAIAMMLPSIVDLVRLDRLLARTDTRVLAADWIRTHVPPGASLYQSGAIYGHVQLAPARGDRELALAGAEGPFTFGGHAVPPPQLIVIQRSPLMYSVDVPFVERTAQAEYVKAAEFVGYDPSRAAGNVYDPLDAFYLPLRGFEGVERPGPNISIYVRR